MKRGPYIGEASVLSRGAFPGIQLQAETAAYLGRFSVTPSQAYKNALNQAIYRWKTAGVFTLLQDLWLLCADTQADSLRNLISPARDAYIIGNPTFTANRGFSGLGSSNYVSLPLSLIGATSTSGFIWAFEVNQADTTGGTVIGPASPLGIAGEVNKSVISGYVGSSMGGGGLVGAAFLGNPTGVATASVHVAGNAGQQGVTASAVACPQTSQPSANPASPMRANSALATRMLAYGVAPSCTSAQARKLCAVLTGFLDEVGAL